MKKMIKKWLGIDELEKKSHYRIPRDEIKTMIGEAVIALLNGERDYNFSMYYADKHVNKFIECVDKECERILRKRVEEEVTLLLDRKLSPEKFIDEIVERIRRKQLD